MKGRRRLAKTALTAAGVLALWSSNAAAGTARFSAPASAVAGREPTAVVAADFDRDGHVDVATADYRSASVSILRGRGDGSLQRRVSYRVARYPAWVLAPDLNGDGWPDLVVSSSDRKGTLAVLLNDGTGRLAGGARYPIDGGWPAMGDVTEDGLLDVVASTDRRRGLAILRGIGGGSFAPAPRVAGPDSGAIALGDVDGDGHLDVAAVTLRDDELALYRGVGDGTFGAPLSYPTGGDSLVEVTLVDVTLMDLDGDGDLDAVTTDIDGGRLLVLPNSGGTFGEPVAYRMPDGPTSALVADFDRDGVLDVATGSVYRDPVVWPGLGGGRLGPFSRIPWFGSVWGTVADFDEDGSPDLAFADSHGVLVSVFLNWTARPAPPCVVQNVLRWTLKRARRYVAFGGCSVGTVTQRHSARVRKGRVITQDPAWGSVRPARDAVDLVVSRGRRR